MALGSSKIDAGQPACHSQILVVSVLTIEHSVSAIVAGALLSTAGVEFESTVKDFQIVISRVEACIAKPFGCRNRR